MSAEQKDNLIVRLKSSGDTRPNNKLVESSSSTSNADRDDIRKRKIQGLLKVIQEKNQQIDSLKSELTEMRLFNSAKTGSMSDLNSSSSNSINNLNTTNHPSSNKAVKHVLELLDKELEIYQKLNSTNK